MKNCAGSVFDMDIQELRAEMKDCYDWTIPATVTINSQIAYGHPAANLYILSDGTIINSHEGGYDCYDCIDDAPKEIQTIHGG